jgi:hypothetical protein
MSGPIIAAITSDAQHRRAARRMRLMPLQMAFARPKQFVTGALTIPEEVLGTTTSIRHHFYVILLQASP